MKKFLVIFIILVILAGAGFLAGWVQLTVPPGSYGVILSKTHGTDPKTVKSGEFRWLWYKLIPTNVKISVFQLESSKFPINYTGTLPSGNSYATFAGLITSDFTWDLKGEISFTIDPDKLVDLVMRHNIDDQEALNTYLYDTAQNIKNLILRTLSSAETERLEKLLSESSDPLMEQEIRSLYPEIKDFYFVINLAKFPDFVLYSQVRMLYEEFLSKQREFVSAAFTTRAETHIETQLHFLELERYGELLTKYPVLLDYLALEGTNKEN
jgi:hypothetical protein